MFTLDSNNFLLWTWAKLHPYLFTWIAILQPSLVALIVLSIINAVTKFYGGGSRRVR